MSNVLLNQEEQGKQNFHRHILLALSRGGVCCIFEAVDSQPKPSWKSSKTSSTAPCQASAPDLFVLLCQISQEPKAGCRFGSSLGYLLLLSHVIAVIWLLLFFFFLPVMPVQLLNLLSLQCYKKQVNPHTNVSVQCCNLITINRSFYEAVNVSSIYKYCTITAGSGVITQSNPLSKPNIS